VEAEQQLQLCGKIAIANEVRAEALWLLERYESKISRCRCTRSAGKHSCPPLSHGTRSSFEPHDDTDATRLARAQTDGMSVYISLMFFLPLAANSKITAATAAVHTKPDADLFD
jgi:hypothetical protein